MGREMDAQVARVLGLDVVGEAWARPFPDGGGDWCIGDKEWEGRSLQPVWLAHCVCKFYPSDEPEWDPDPVLGHYPGCLEVAAFYSEDWAAMQQVVQAVRCGTVEGHVAGAIEMTVSDNIPPNDCHCHIYGPSIAGGAAYADELPEAVALAFLEAMGK